MPSVYKLEFADGRKEVDEEYTFFARGGFFYVIDDQTFLKQEDIIAWCFDCDKMVSAEDVPSVTSLDEEIWAMDHPDSEAYLKMFKRPMPLAENAWWKFKRERVLEWRKRRASPAHCLTCGKSNLFFFPFKEWASHPKTGEKCRLYSAGISSMAYKRTGYWDIEGTRLQFSDDEYAEMQSRRKSWEEAEDLKNPFPSRQPRGQNTKVENPNS